MSSLHVPIICYHRIAVLPDDDALKPYSVTPRSFAQQMAYLAAHGYHSIALSDLLRGTPQHCHRRFVLTFDDGYIDTYDVAYPILRQHGFEAMVFLVSGWLQTRSRRANLPVEMLSEIHVSEMSRCGMAFGAHSRCHRRLTELRREDLWYEVGGSKEDLEHALGLPITAFAYPYGLSNPHVQRVVKACGYDLAVAVANGTGDRFNLRRIVITPQDNLSQFAWKVAGWRSIFMAGIRGSLGHSEI